MKKFTLAAITAMLAAFAVHGADYYQFSVGSAIPLFDTEKQALSHVATSSNVGYESSEHFGSTKNGSSLTLYLKNETAGTYYLTLLGANNNNSASSYKLTVENEDGTYKRESGKIVQPQTSNWTIVAPGGIKLDDLPAGNFTVKMEISMTSGNWAGNYGKFTIYKNVYDTSVNTGDNSLFKLDKDGTMASNWYSPTDKSNDKENEFGNFSSNNSTFDLYFYVAERGAYEMSYSGRVNDDRPTTAAWTLIGNGASAEFTDNIKQTGDSWNGIAYYTNSVGVLSKGFYRVEGKVTSDNNWRGYYGNFRFTQTAGCKTVAAGETWELDEDTTLAELTVGAGATIDLKGHDLTVMNITDADTASYTVTNTDNDKLSVFTAATEGQPYSTLDAILTGNLKYVTTGGSIECNQDRTANSHTGGTVVSNSTITLKKDVLFGTGPLTLTQHGYVKYIDVYKTWTHPVEVYGTENKLEAHGGTTWSGALTGDGELTVSCGWGPQLKFEGDLSAFTGKFICAYSPNSSQVNGTGGVYLGSGSHSCDLSKAEVQIHRFDSTPANGSLLRIQDSADAYLGNLTTDTDDVDEQQYSILYGHRQGGTTLHVGGRNENGTFAGLIKEYQDSDNYKVSVDKVGTGTWTLKAAQTYKGTTTVSGGTLILDMAEFSNSTVTVKNGGAIGGSAVIEKIVFDGGTLADEDTGVKVKDAEGWPELSAASKAANEADKKGKYKIVRRTNLDGTTTFKREYFLNGLVIIIR